MGFRCQRLRIARCSQCIMAARAALALAALAVLASAQPTYVYVREDSNVNDVDDVDVDVEQRQTTQLRDELRSAREDALLLYTEYSAKVGKDMKTFIKEMVDLKEEATKGVEETLRNAPEHCTAKYDLSVAEAVRDARRAATFSAENHHKFLLGHMVVFRMHLNKSDDYIKKCDKMFLDCGLACETMPRMKRWRSLAQQEINRVRDDILHSRHAYKDLVAHATRKLNHVRKHTRARADKAVEELEKCIKS
ncbi:uncharacterized protein LOC134674144 [Cydia fagiglandana]|uniref:uncharacterized protein LOC134674144 n=1 Tax=Cydia fagiglandana TaxID=1458189 RepID=UPI002FEDEC6E